MSVSGRWVSWTEAAALAGVRVPTDEHAVRVGRIALRPHNGAAPTLDRESVLTWANWYAETQVGLTQRRAARERARDARKSRGRARAQMRRDAAPAFVPVSADETWLTVHQAAARLGCSESSVLRWADAGHLVAKVDGQVWLAGSSVEHLAQARAHDAGQWVSQAAAAGIVGCSHARVPDLVAEGLLVQRPGPRGQASISRASAETAARVWAARLAAAEAARAARLAARPSNAAPDDGQVWVTTATAALVLGMSRNGVGERIRAGTLPAVLRGNRYWLRRTDVETAATARVFRLGQAEADGSDAHRGPVHLPRQV